MTAVVGILNKHAVAIAADSAVTIGGPSGSKIFNKANKIFTLSKKHPVGIMIYNAASFMATPWETIIKIYREQLNDRYFSTLKEYQQDFIEFLRSKSFYTNVELQIVSLENFIQDIITSVSKDIAQNQSGLIQSSLEDRRAELLRNFENQIERHITHWNQTELCTEFKDYTFEMFNTYSDGIFKYIVQKRFVENGIEISAALFLKIKQCVYTILRVKENVSSYTGLIFTGFGEDEIYPQLIPVNISMLVDNRLRYYIDERNIASISNENIGCVRPFAQTDVIDTILSGIDPSLDDIYLRNFEALFNNYNQTILDSIGNSNPLLSEQIQNLNTNDIVNEFNNMNNHIKIKNYINPLINAVSNLAKDDLIEMAESLIYLTYLKRRITFAEESVGGPVDVAVISKGDGFIWIKRKHYFKPELNGHFFNNYFQK